MYTGNTSSSFFVAFVALFAIVAMTGPASADTIPLMWDPNPETDIAGYIVHVGTEMGNHTQHIDVGPATSWQFPDAVPGQQYCFAVSAYFSGPVESPRSADVCGHSNATPTLGNPGSRTSTAGVETTLQLAGSDPQGEPLTYSATGLPPGLWVMTATGFIFGTPTTPGAYTVTAQASDGVLTASQTFTWTVVAQDSASPTVTITSPTSASTYAARAVTLTLTGTAADNVGVTQVTWVNNRGGSGTATGTTSWSTSVALQAGDNVVTVTARDATGNTAMDVLTVSYAAAPIQAGPLQMVSLTPDRAAPQAPGTAITWTAVSAGGQGPYQYKWWVFENGGWVVAQTWSASNTYVWQPTRAASTYQVKAAVRSTSNGESADKYVAYSIAAYVDVTAPTVSIASPTTTTTWSTASNTLTLSGTASDNAGVTQVSWVNNRGGSGTATGTTSWTASVALQAGDNLVTVTARDAIGNTAVDTLTVSYSVGPIQVVSLTPDRAAPQAPGTAITWTAVAAGGQGPYQYKFWVLEATGWVTKQTWSASNTYVWQPTSASSAYQVKVAVRSTTNGESDDNYATYVIR